MVPDLDGWLIAGIWVECDCLLLTDCESEMRTGVRELWAAGTASSAKSISRGRGVCTLVLE